MNKVEVSKSSQTVYVGGGAQWMDVYKHVEAENLLVVGGRVADVGVGGLLTGGKRDVSITLTMLMALIRWHQPSLEQIWLGMRQHSVIRGRSPQWKHHVCRPTTSS